MSINIPYDVWYRISRFIHPIALCELYSVNRALFEIAMNERYREVQFSHDSMLDTKRKITRIREPCISSRVQSLVIGSSIGDGQLPDEFMPELLDAFTRLVNVRKIFWHLYESHEWLAGPLMQAIASLPSLTEFSISVWAPDFSPLQWHILKNLRGLAVHCPVVADLEWLKPGIVQAIANNSDLQQLKIIDFKSEKGVFNLHEFLPSISDNSPLKIQELWLEGTNPHLDSSSILRLRSLKSLIWRASSDESNDDLFRASGVWQAFRRSGICLSHLKTDMIDGNLLEYLSSFQGLRELELNVRRSANTDKLVGRFFRETLPLNAHTLESLSIQSNDEGWCVGQDNIFSIGSCQNLRKLQVPIFCSRSNADSSPLDDQDLDAAVFLLLDYTRQLPKLQSLEISPVLRPLPWAGWALIAYDPFDSVYDVTESISMSMGRFEVSGGIDMVANVVPEVRVGDTIFALRRGKYVPEEDCWDTGYIYDRIIILP